ncbi:MAG: Asp-tRNA(Asn)/Glu-tRNA(Gln) amidotransferase subunit GatA [Planctomycetes bacterium]|nr:Asp-tRNA(Asn)/Glu-tRNA(Gln) amidotransferase subunit GatA [Planctomycetota bacterium]
MSDYTLSASAISRLVRSGDVKAVDSVSSAFTRIEQVEPRVDAFLHLDRAGAMAAAEAVDRMVASGADPGPLAGVPVAVKDNIATPDLPTSCASRILKNYVPPYSAAVVERLRSAGAVIVGKTNMDEFAMGSSCENSAFKPTRNPHDLSRIPGGSSGGSAAAVASAMVPVSLGSDTGGSIRQPAALTGTVGFKPTYGRVSRYGLIAFGSSLDQIGPFSRTVEDCALLMKVISGRDPRDSTCSSTAVPDFLSFLNDGVRSLRIGLPAEYFIDGMQPEVEKSVRAAAEVFTSLGARTLDISLPHTRFAVAVYYVVATAEASSNLARYDGVHYGYRTPEAVGLVDLYQKTRRDGFGDEVKRRIMLGTFALSSGYSEAYYKKALQVRSLMKRDFDLAFQDVDVIIAPTTPTTAFRIGEKINDPLSMYLSDVFTISANLATIPAVSLPCGLDSSGLPIGIQIMAPPFREDLVLKAAASLERALGIAPLTADP